MAWIIFIMHQLGVQAPPVEVGDRQWVADHCHVYGEAKPMSDYSVHKDANGRPFLRQNDSLVFNNLYLCDNDHAYIKRRDGTFKDDGKYR